MPISHLSVFFGEMSIQVLWTFMFFVLLEMEFHSVAQAEVQWCHLCILCLPGSRDSPVPQVAGTTGARHHTQLIFLFLVEMRFHHVDQDGLDLLTS